jgi:hypothetical protein
MRFSLESFNFIHISANFTHGQGEWHREFLSLSSAVVTLASAPFSVNYVKCSQQNYSARTDPEGERFMASRRVQNDFSREFSSLVRRNLWPLFRQLEFYALCFGDAFFGGFWPSRLRGFFAALDSRNLCTRLIESMH